LHDMATLDKSKIKQIHQLVIRFEFIELTML
jgi:hypothetical protein